LSASLTVAASVDDALSALAEGARAVAGGTDLVVGARQGKAPLPQQIVAIHRLAELRSINQSDQALRAGALTTHADLVADTTVQRQLTALADACAIVGSHATRAVGTIGGNLMNASPAMESGGPLLCFDSTVTLRSGDGSRTLGIAELLAGPGQTTARPAELLESVTVPFPPANAGSGYVRLEYRRQMEIAVVGATAVLAFQDGKVTHARVAITALAPTIRRVPEAEHALLGSDAGSDAAGAAARAVAEASQPISDVRASTKYRTAMAEVIGRRAIDVAVTRARGQQVPIPASPETHGGLR
jgi:CO/xanthine dehydrogenase FAD-binding subunit